MWYGMEAKKIGEIRKSETWIKRNAWCFGWIMFWVYVAVSFIIKKKRGK